jgi:hypothetical protein
MDDHYEGSYPRVRTLSRHHIPPLSKMRSIILCGAAPPVYNRRALVMGLQLRIVNPLTTIYTVPAMKTSVRRRGLYGPAP